MPTINPETAATIILGTFLLALVWMFVRSRPRPHPAAMLFSPPQTPVRAAGEGGEAARRLAYQAVGQSIVLWASPYNWFQRVNLMCDSADGLPDSTLQNVPIPTDAGDTRLCKFDELAACFAGPVAEMLAFGDARAEDPPLAEDSVQFLLTVLIDEHRAKPPSLPLEWGDAPAAIYANPLLRAALARWKRGSWHAWLANRANLRAREVILSYQSRVPVLAEMLLKRGKLARTDLDRVLGENAAWADRSPSMTAS